MAKMLLALLVLALAICHSSIQGVPQLPQDAREYIEAHNQARAHVGVCPLMWNYSLAKGASQLVQYQRNRKVCTFANLTGTKYHRYGANQFVAGGLRLPPCAVVDEWVKEKKYYNYANDWCAPNHKCCGYRQVVWRKSLELGCAQATCGKNIDGCLTLTICLYNPPGNYKGQRPY